MTTITDKITEFKVIKYLRLVDYKTKTELFNAICEGLDFTKTVNIGNGKLVIDLDITLCQFYDEKFNQLININSDRLRYLLKNGYRYGN